MSRCVHLRDLAKPVLKGAASGGARVRRIDDMVSPPSERVLALPDRLSERLSRTQPKNFLVKAVEAPAHGSRINQTPQLEGHDLSGHPGVTPIHDGVARPGAGLVILRVLQAHVLRRHAVG